MVANALLLRRWKPEETDPMNIGAGRARLRRVGEDDPLLREHRPAARAAALRGGVSQLRPDAVNTLRFIGRAREFGLPTERIRLLVGLWQDGGRASRDVKAIALDHVAALRRQAARLAEMADALERVAETCSGDHRPECPILRDLEAAREATPAA